jgi:Type II CAAX prenyl endopeptidase Rce1-like
LLLAIQFGSVWLWETNEVHPLFKMVRDELSPGVPQLAILLAVIIAPLCEEVLFRGIIQTWVVSRFNRLGLESAPAPAERSAIAEFQALPEVSLSHAQADAPEAATDQCRNSVGTPSEPPPDAPSAPLERRPSSLAAIITISLIFAALHWPQWPAPISIFVLSVTIGYIYQRTGSLIAAVCMHAMFNGLSTLILIGSLFFPQSAQHPDAKTAKPHAAIATFSAPRDCACIHCKK